MHMTMQIHGVKELLEHGVESLGTLRPPPTLHTVINIKVGHENIQ